jgi:hypothetical protein
MNEEERGRIIIEYISIHQGCKAEEVVDGVKDHISRVPVFKILKALIEEGIVKDETSNRRDCKLFVAENNLLVSIPKELQDFEAAFLNLLQKSKSQLGKKDISDIPQITQRSGNKQGAKRSESDIDRFSTFQYGGLQKLSDLIESTIVKLAKTTREYSTRIDSKPEYKVVRVPTAYKNKMTAHISSLRLALEDARQYRILFLPFAALWLFDSMLRIYLYRSAFIWSIKIQNKDYLKKLYILIYSRIAAIQNRLSEFFQFLRGTSDSEASDSYITLLSHTRSLFSESIFTLPIYTELDMKKEIELVANSLCRISDELGKNHYIIPEFSQCRKLLENLKLYDLLLQLEVQLSNSP